MREPVYLKISPELIVTTFPSLSLAVAITLLLVYLISTVVEGNVARVSTSSLRLIGTKELEVPKLYSTI